MQGLTSPWRKQRGQQPLLRMSIAPALLCNREIHYTPVWYLVDLVKLVKGKLVSMICDGGVTSELSSSRCLELPRRIRIKIVRLSTLKWVDS